jgi:uridine kinase
MRKRIDDLVNEILSAKDRHHGKNLFTVAISGIDASGKGYISNLLQKQLEKKSYKVAKINIDPWQNPLPVRLKKENAAENVYENIFRWNDFFEQLIFPLQKNRSICLETKGIRSDADVYYPLVYNYKNPDIMLIEGIFLFKEKYLPHYDYKLWIECSFKTGLQRAISRNVEKLSREQLIHDYETFYYPAQRLHFEKDDPKGTADTIFFNEE